MTTIGSLRVDCVKYGYQSADPIVDDFTLQIERGERVAILGESGSGKSTVVGLLCGLLNPQAGRVTLNGRSVHQIPHEDRGFALVPQRPNPIAYLTGEELLRRPAARCPDAKDKIQFAMKTLGIDSQLLRRPLRNMSGGQLQLLYLARAFVWKPDYVFLDEPFNSIDSSLKTANVYPSVLQLHNSTACGLVLVTHDPREALLMCTRLVVMRLGRKVADGDSVSLFREPPDAGTALMIRGSSTNLLDVDLSFDGDSKVVATSIVGELRGRFVAGSGFTKANPRVVGLFPWDHLVARGANTPIDQSAPYGTPVRSPTVLRIRGTTLYAVSGATDGDICCISRELVLYDPETKKLIGRIEVSRASGPVTLANDN